VILARTIKGYGLGEAGEGRNITHQQKKLAEQELREFRARFGIPVSDEDLASTPLYKPPDDSAETVYIKHRRERLGGYVPERHVYAQPIEMPSEDVFKEFFAGTEGRAVSSTMAFVRLLARLMKDPKVGRLVVPIVPDEARTFGMESLFRQFGIYSHVGQLYDPVDSKSLLFYREATDGQILEEGITEAGSMASFAAAGTAYATHGINTIPFFIYYSMFGFQRIGDLMWAAADMRCRGFLVGGTSGRTTLAGEGLQHQDGHSHHLMQVIPTVRAYDPAYAYEIAVIVRDGLDRMYRRQEEGFTYFTVCNENYPMPRMPEGAEAGHPRRDVPIARRERRRERAARAAARQRADSQRSAARADLLAERFDVAADVWSVTSWTELRREALAAERWNMLHPGDEQRAPYFTRMMSPAKGPIVAASDYLKALPDGLARWSPRRMTSLGTDGFGRSEGRTALRDFFEVDARHIAFAAVRDLELSGAVGRDEVLRAQRELEIDSSRPDPVTR
jgi:pyruvate dehydrogenase E1 component